MLNYLICAKKIRNRSGAPCKAPIWRYAQETPKGDPYFGDISDAIHFNSIGQAIEWFTINKSMLDLQCYEEKSIKVVKISFTPVKRLMSKEKKK